MVINDLKKKYLTTKNIRSLVNHLFQHNVFNHQNHVGKKTEEKLPKIIYALQKRIKAKLLLLTITSQATEGTIIRNCHQTLHRNPKN